jgi:signal transduction histidine kinase
VVFAGAGQEVLETGGIDEAKQHLSRIEDAAQQALWEMRLLVYELRPPALEEEGLVGALRHRLETVERRTGVAASLQVDGVIDLPAPVEEGLYRIAQEALNNALKHAAASSVTVRIQAIDGRVELEVIDDGAGFDFDTVRDRGGVGLASMRERAEQLGGKFQVQSAPGFGTTVRASEIPSGNTSKERRAFS